MPSPAPFPAPPYLQNLAVLGAAAAAAIAVNCLFEAQKVWKLGFDAEMKLYRRAAARFMSSPDFSPGHRYIMVQGGSPAFRTRFTIRRIITAATICSAFPMFRA